MSATKYLAITLPILASTAYVVELSLVPLILPSLRSDLNLDVSVLAAIFNAYASAVAIAVLLGGWMGDTFGARRVFVFGVFLFVLGSLGVASSSEQVTLVAARVVQGIGGGLFSPLIPVLLAKAAAPRPGRLLILWGSMSGFIAGLAPLAAHQLLGLFGWPLVFISLAGLAVPALFLGPTALDEKEKSPEPRKTFSAMLRQPKIVWGLYGYIFCNFGTIMLFLFLLPVTLHDLGFPQRDQAYALAVFWVVFSAAGYFLRNLVDTRAIWPILLLSPVLICAGYVAFLMPASAVSIALSSALVGIGFACGNATSTTLVLSYCLKGTNSTAASLDISIARFGAVVVVFFAAPLDALSMFWVVAGLCAITGVFGVLASFARDTSAVQTQ